jgi:hypothetical protein
VTFYSFLRDESSTVEGDEEYWIRGERFGWIVGFVGQPPST